MMLFVKFFGKNKDVLERFKNFCEFFNKILSIWINEKEKGKIAGFSNECKKGIKGYFI